MDYYNPQYVKGSTIPELIIKQRVLNTAQTEEKGDWTTQNVDWDVIYDINGLNFRDIKVAGSKLFNQTKYIGFPVNLPNSTPDFPDFREAHHHGKPKANKNSWLTWLEVWAPSKHRKKPWKSHGKPSFWEHTQLPWWDEWRVTRPFFPTFFGFFCCWALGSRTRSLWQRNPSSNWRKVQSPVNWSQQDLWP